MEPNSACRGCKSAALCLTGMVRWLQFPRDDGNGDEYSMILSENGASCGSPRLDMPDNCPTLLHLEDARRRLNESMQLLQRIGDLSERSDAGGSKLIP